MISPFWVLILIIEFMSKRFAIVCFVFFYIPTLVTLLTLQMRALGENFQNTFLIKLGKMQAHHIYHPSSNTLP